MEEIGSVNAIIHKIQSTADGGIRLTLDIGAESGEIGAKLLKLKAQGREYISVGMVQNETN